jgi:virginiamycin B lyase
VNQNFISGAGSGSGIAIHGKYIYFTSNGGTGIGRAKLNGTDVNPNFITGLNGEIAFLAVDSKYIFWADWGDRGTWQSGSNTIGRANIDGTDVNQSFITGADGPSASR